MTSGPARSRRVLVPLLGILIAFTGVYFIRGHLDDVVAWDYPLYYSAGRLPGPILYDKKAQEADQRLVYSQELAALRPYHFSIYLKPAAYKLVLDPFARLPFWDAYLLWVTLQMAGLAGALYLFSRDKGFPLEWWVLLPFNPFLFDMVYWGQDTGLVLLALGLAWTLSVRGAWFTAGACLALCLVKWNLFLLLAPLLIAQRKWRALAGFATVAAMGGAVSVLITGWQGVGAYLRLLGAREADYLAVGMPSVRGQLLLLGAPEAFVTATVVSLNAVLWRFERRLEWRAAFAAAIAGCVALSYHTMIYDQLFLLAPALLLRDENNLRSFGYMALFTVWIAPVAQVGPVTGVASVAMAGAMALSAYRR